MINRIRCMRCQEISQLNIPIESKEEVKKRRSKVIAGYNDLATVRPDLLAEFDYEKNASFKPNELYVLSQRKVWWKCKNGHEWQERVFSRGTLGAGCPFCLPLDK